MPRKKDSNEKVIRKKTKVTVSNTLNQMIFQQKDMNLQAFRMLMFYLAKINPARPDLTVVKVPLETYAEMLGVELNEQAIDASTDVLMGYILKTGTIDSGDYIIKNAKYSVFSVCRLTERKSDGKLMLEFKCSEDIKPLIFEIQSQFTMFNVWNVLNLSNFQDIRMYMLLSQYKVAGSKTFTLEELKDKLGINRNSYPEYKEFARTVIKKCQKALKERTDICFEFKSVGRPAHSVHFEIAPNTDYAILKYLEEELAKKEDRPQQLPGQMGLDDLDYTADPSEDEERDPIENRVERDEICTGFSDKIFDEFTDDQLRELHDLAIPHVTQEMRDFHYRLGPLEAARMAASDYIKQKIRYCNSYREPIPHRYGFIRKAVAENWR